jgi:hypothetical protein
LPKEVPCTGNSKGIKDAKKDGNECLAEAAHAYEALWMKYSEVRKAATSNTSSLYRNLQETIKLTKNQTADVTGLRKKMRTAEAKAYSVASERSAETTRLIDDLKTDNEDLQLDKRKFELEIQSQKNEIERLKKELKERQDERDDDEVELAVGGDTTANSAQEKKQRKREGRQAEAKEATNGVNCGASKRNLPSNWSKFYCC